jgi:4-carboxymuconolactone decarboxylase
VRLSNSVRTIVSAGLLGLLAGAVYGQAAGQSGTTTTSALPADIDPASGNRLPLPNREDMNESDKKLFDEVMKVQEGGLGSREKERPQVRLYSPTLSKALSDAHHYLKYDTGFGDRITTIAVLTTARELTNQFEWTQWEEHARNQKDSRKVEPNVIDVIKSCKPVAGLDEKDAAIIKLGREIFGTRRVSSATFAEVLRLFGRRGTVDLVELMALYAATGAELVAFDQQLHAGQPALLPAHVTSCGK